MKIFSADAGRAMVNIVNDVKIITVNRLETFLFFINSSSNRIEAETGTAFIFLNLKGEINFLFIKALSGFVKDYYKL